MLKNAKNGRENGNLYDVTGHNDSGEDSDPWDDELLIKAYEETIRLTKEDVAKKVASATNTPRDDPVDESAGRRSLAWHPVKYKVGDFVRAVYRDDGIEYEAVVVSTSGGTGKCLIKFIGYENEQYVSVAELKDSLGGEVRMEQIEASLGTPGAGEEDETQSVASEEPVAHSSTSAKASGDATASLHALLNAGSFVPPMSMQPPPLPPFANDSTEEGKHLAAMLMAWYTSGYYTGLYDAHRITQKQKTDSQNTN